MSYGKLSDWVKCILEEVLGYTENLHKLLNCRSITQNCCTTKRFNLLECERDVLAAVSTFCRQFNSFYSSLDNATVRDFEVFCGVNSCVKQVKHFVYILLFKMFVVISSLKTRNRICECIAKTYSFKFQ